MKKDLEMDFNFFLNEEIDLAEGTLRCNSTNTVNQNAVTKDRTKDQAPQRIPGGDKTKEKKTPVDKLMIKKYLQLDKEITKQERANSVKILAMKEDMIKEYDAMVTKAVNYFEICTKQISSATTDKSQILTVHKYLDDHYTFDNDTGAKILQLSESEEDYLDELNRLEIAKKELDLVNKQRECLKQEIMELNEKVAELNKVYAEQDALIAVCFDGTYGSKLEKDLEGKLDASLERKQKIQLTQQRWKMTNTLCRHALRQMDFAVGRWQEVAMIPQGQLENRYTSVKDVRNHLVCASQNILVAQKYLKNVTFPYCTPQEINTLRSATVHVFSDVMTVFRHAYALQCFSTTHKRLDGLCQWMENIINTDMQRDLTKVSEETDDLNLDLREERVRLLTAKVKAQGDNMSLRDFNLEDEQYKEDKKVAKMGPITIQEIARPPKPTTDVTTPRRIKVAPPITIEENGAVASPHEDEDLDGDISQIKKQHQKQMEMMEKQERLAKARTELSLNQKLQQRRSSKMMQLEELSQSVGKSFKQYRADHPVDDTEIKEATTQLTTIENLEEV